MASLPTVTVKQIVAAAERIKFVSIIIYSFFFKLRSYGEVENERLMEIHYYLSDKISL
jgi:hypothetical protein